LEVETEHDVVDDDDDTDDDREDTEEGNGNELDSDDGDEEGSRTDDIIASMVNLPRFPCMAHCLQLVVKELSKSDSYKKLIAKVKDLVKFVKISSVANEKLRDLCGKGLVRDCITRWNSILLMIDRLLIIRSPLEV
jgi:hypothetical protein